MKRAEKKTTTPEKSAGSSEKPVAATSSEQKNQTDIKEKSVVAKKPLKKLKPETSSKNSEEKEIALISKKPKPDVEQKTAKKLKPETPVKSSVTPPKAKKQVSGKVIEKEKVAPLKKNKTVATEEKSVGKSKSVNSAKISVSKPEVKKTSAINSASKQKKIKVVQPVSGKKPKLKKETILPKSAGKKIKPVQKKVEIVVPVITRKRTKAAEKKVGTVASVKNPKSGKKDVAAEKKIAQKDRKKIEKKVEIVVPPIAVNPVKKKLKPIGSAVVRGKIRRYDFEVFPLDAELKDGSAIYVISKRITDKRGRGHHKFVCIGQTESLLGEIKRHQKDKCIKQHKANVICLLREESETNRLKIETDLREAHTIACNQK